MRVDKKSHILWSLWCLGEVLSHLPTEVFGVGVDVWMIYPQPSVQRKIITAGHHLSDMSRERWTVTLNCLFLFNDYKRIPGWTAQMSASQDSSLQQFHKVELFFFFPPLCKESFLCACFDISKKIKCLWTYFIKIWIFNIFNI